MPLEVMPVTQAAQITAPRTAPVEACPLCCEKESIALFSAPDRLHGTPGIFQYRRCKACRTVFQDPRVIPDDLALCYPAGYYAHAPQNGSGDAELNLPNQARQLSGLRDALRQAVVASVKGVPMRGKIGWAGRILVLSRYARERAFYNHVVDELLPRAPGVVRALDVGCGAGYLMTLLMRQVGWEVEGVEWDTRAAVVARQRSQCRVWEGDFRQVNLPQETYHRIVLSHVLEHLDDPIGALSRVSELLAPGGRAVFFYPNPESLGARFFNSAWYHWDAPRHLVFPTTRGIAKAARSVGLIPLKVNTTARFAQWALACSRSYQAGRPIGATCPDSWDCGMGYLERVLIRFGAGVGEEIIAVLVKPVTE